MNPLEGGGGGGMCVSELTRVRFGAALVLRHTPPPSGFSSDWGWGLFILFHVASSILHFLHGQPMTVLNHTVAVFQFRLDLPCQNWNTQGDGEGGMCVLRLRKPSRTECYLLEVNASWFLLYWTLPFKSKWIVNY